MLRMVVEVLAWGAVVAAGGFVVAATDGFVEWTAVGIDVEGEAFVTATGRAGVAASGVGVFLKGVVVWHDCDVLVVLSQCPSPRDMGQWDRWDKVIAVVLRRDGSEAASKPLIY